MKQLTITCDICKQETVQVPLSTQPLGWATMTQNGQQFDVGPNCLANDFPAFAVAVAPTPAPVQVGP